MAQTVERRASVPLPQDVNLPCYAKFKIFYKAEKHLGNLLAFVMVTFTLLLSGMIVFQVLSRYVFKIPLLGVDEITPLIALWAYFIGVAYSVRIREHIQGGVISLVCKNNKIIKFVRWLGTAAVIVAMVIFTGYIYNTMMLNFTLGRTSTYMKWPKWLWDASVFAGFVLSNFYFILQFCVETVDMFSKEEEA